MGNQIEQAMQRAKGERERVEHHPLFPPSASSRWLTCTASPLPISHEKISEEPNYYAAEGTFAHWVFAELGSKGETQFEVGKTYECDKCLIEYTEDMHEHILDALDHVVSLGPGATMWEQRVGFRVADVAEPIDGTADVVKVTDAEPHVLHVCDLKFGKGNRVDAERNTQMMSYAAGVYEQLAFLFENITEVRVHVLQPRLDHYPSDSMTVSELLQWQGGREVGQVTRAVWEALSLNGYEPQYRPSEDACRWCPLRDNCTHREQWVTQVVGDFFEDYDKANKQQAASAGHALPLERLGQWLTWAPVVKEFIKHAEERALALELSGEDVPGWKAVEGKKGNRKLNDLGTAEELLVEKYPETDFFTEPVFIDSPSQLEKLIGKKPFAKLLGHMVTQSRGNPTLAPDDDPRPPYVLATASDFDSHDGENDNA